MTTFHWLQLGLSAAGMVGTFLYGLYLGRKHPDSAAVASELEASEAIVEKAVMKVKTP